MTKSARRKDSEQRSIELDLKMEVMLMKEQLMELQEDYDDLKNDYISTLCWLDHNLDPLAGTVCFDFITDKLLQLGFLPLD